MLRLEEFPRGTATIGSSWQEALGDPRRVADWTAYFLREVTDQPWRQTLETWWPRLLPGVVAAATHGVIGSATQFGRSCKTAKMLIMSPSWHTALPIGPPAGSRYPALRPSSHTS